MLSICICTTYISKHILYYIHVFNLTTNDDDIGILKTDIRYHVISADIYRSCKKYRFRYPTLSICHELDKM